MRFKYQWLLLMLIALLCLPSCAGDDPVPGTETTMITESTEEIIASGYIRSIVPNGSIYVRPGDEVNVIITGSSDWAFSVRCGINTYDAKDLGIRSGHFSVYEAKVKMPESDMEIESIGTIMIIGRKGNSSFSVEGPRPKPDTSKEDGVPDPGTDPDKATTLKADNRKQENDDDNTVTTEKAAPPDTRPTEKSGSYQAILPSPSAQSGDLAVVTGNITESFPTYCREKRFNPSFSQLLPGTSVMVTDTYESPDSDGGTYEYAVLTNGCKVLTEDITVTGGAMPETNDLTYLGSEMTPAGIKLKFRQGTKTPFNFYLGGQNYTRSDGKNFPVSAFTANAINFCFYNTTGFSGSMDAVSSDIINAPAVSSDPTQKTVTLTFPLKMPGTFYGYKAGYDQSGQLEITINNKHSGISGAVIMLDPGHGGSDPGALGYGDQIKECDINLSVAAYLKTELENMGATVYLTRYNDTHVSLEYRREYAYSLNPDLFVSIHSNAAENPDSYGTSVFYYHAMSFPLAYSIYNHMLSSYYTDVYPDDPARASDSGIGVMYYPFAVTRGMQCPSVLVETGYLTNDREALRLADENVRRSFAKAIAEGIRDTLDQ